MKLKILTFILFIVSVISINNILFQAPKDKKIEAVESGNIILKSGSIKYADNNTSQKYVTANLLNKPLPTNKFWSEIVNTGKISGIFTNPYQLTSTDKSLIISIPQKVVSSDLVANHSHNILEIVPNENIASVKVNDYSSITVNISFRNLKDDELFNINLIEGSPYIFANTNSQNIKINSFVNLNTSDKKLILENTAIFTKSDYSVYQKNIDLKFDQNQNSFTIGFISDIKNYDEVKKFAFNSIKSVDTQYTSDNKNVNTNFSFNYNSNVTDLNTLWGLLPHQTQWNTFNYIYQTDTLRGLLKFFEVSNVVKLNTPLKTPLEDLDLKNLNAEDKNLLDTTLKTDYANLTPVRTTSYFGGKDLAKYARLLQISKDLNENDISDNLESKLKQNLVDWFNYANSKSSKYFVYDKTNKGLIAQTPEFGSQNYNDHHFHYGYFIYASAILSKYDDNFYKNYKDFVDMIISDISNYGNTSNFPQMRVFDPYEGHSWASGFEDFADGNNEESTSEAINAWYSMYLWGKQTDNSSLTNLSLNLYSDEINSSNFYWLNRYPSSQIFPKEYKHDKASLVWSGKFEFNTFFSKDPLAINGIQYLPITPGSTYLYDKNSVSRDCNNFKLSPSVEKTGWVDINTMYCSMVIKNYPNDVLKNIKVDDGNTSSNLLSWVMYWKNQK